MIPYFILSNGVMVPTLGLGTYLTTDEDACKIICDAVEVGYRSVDTAMIYMNEVGVGKGIRSSGIPREELYVTTKLWNDGHGFDSALKSFSASLSRLGLDYIDEYLIHWPGMTESYKPTWRALEKLYKEGYVRTIGVCNFLKHTLKSLIDSCEIKPMVNQVEMHPFFQPNDLIKFCQKEEILIEAWRPIVWGKLEKEPLISIAEKYGKSPVQVALRWENQRGIRPLPKSKCKSRMTSNIQIFDFSLSAEEMLLINELNTYNRTGESPDEFFEIRSFD